MHLLSPLPVLRGEGKGVGGGAVALRVHPHPNAAFASPTGSIISSPIRPSGRRKPLPESLRLPRAAPRAFACPLLPAFRHIFHKAIVAD